MSASHVTDLLPGPLHPDLFEPELTPSLLVVDQDEPRWRAEVLDTHTVWIDTGELAMIPRLAQEYADETGADGYEILGVRRDAGTCCAPQVLLAVQIGITYHLDVVADTSHEALEIAQHIASRRWPRSEVVGVDLVLPQGNGGV